MAIDANDDMKKMQQKMADSTGTVSKEETGISLLMNELTASVPGIDKDMFFSELMKQVQSLDYDVVMFDTALKEHTFSLLNFSNNSEYGLRKGFGAPFTIFQRSINYNVVRKIGMCGLSCDLYYFH